ncbi:MAG: NADH-quinone oxidoreductase subunit F, partial [Christensenellaceae bacterium]|nr:NADH-quinone oxidoreductase subunit F [Christensenellaceae bacterium]
MPARLNDRDALIKLRERCETASRAESQKILVCAGTGCIASGSLMVYDRLKALMEARGIACAVELDAEPHEHVGLKKSGCHGFCEMGALVRIEPQGWLYTRVKADDCEEIVEKTIARGEHIERLAYAKGGQVRKRQDEIPFYERLTRLVLGLCGHIDANSIEEYLAAGGYVALEKALFDMDRDGIIQEITESNL